ncbi:MAG: AmmeMemoRadiSam system protein B, partial [Candidatus Bipolaricaulota bacterium]
AGYRASGPVAACAYEWLSRVGEPGSVVIIGTNHTGLGPAASVLAEGSWSTPLGEQGIDTELAGSLVGGSDLLENSSTAFTREHSIETQLPFLQHLLGTDFSFVPICPRDQSRETAVEIGKTIAAISPPGTLMIASSDFSHYEPQDVAEKKDRSAIDSILDMDVGRFYERVDRENITICGFGPIGSLIAFAQEEGLSPEELGYATSGEITGMGKEVVGYSAIGFRG